MKSGSELVKAGLRAFFENAAEDLEKTLENLKLGKFTHSRTQIKGVSQNINYTTVALLPILIHSNSWTISRKINFCHLQPLLKMYFLIEIVLSIRTAKVYSFTLQHN